LRRARLLSRPARQRRGAIINIVGRLRKDDLVDHVRGQEEWEVVRFAAGVEDDEVHEIASMITVSRLDRSPKTRWPKPRTCRSLSFSAASSRRFLLTTASIMAYAVDVLVASTERTEQRVSEASKNISGNPPAPKSLARNELSDFSGL
jgi:hypothetical protein